jgi:ubiquinone/menaquinone biosynthesis C-methylase UbiE
LLDIGCGTHYTFLSAVKPYIYQGYGIDFKVQALKTNKIIIKQIKIEKKLPFRDNMFDVITMLVVLEHLKHLLLIIKEVEKILKLRVN